MIIMFILIINVDDWHCFSEANFSILIEYPVIDYLMHNFNDKLSINYVIS